MGTCVKKYQGRERRNDYQVLRRQYCRRYGLPPESTLVSYRELIEDAAFVEEEANGWLRADRTETVLSAICYLMTILCAAKGVDPKELDKIIGHVEATRPRNFDCLSEEEKKEREDAETRSQVHGFIASIKAMSAGKTEEK